MALREGEKQVRKHIWLFEQDVEDIKALFGDSIGESKVIRHMVRKCVKQLKAAAEAQRPAKGTTRALDVSIEKALEKMEVEGL